jgi:type IV pilus assembly protein PilC
VRKGKATLHFAELLLVLLKGKINLFEALYVLTGEGIEKPVRESASALLMIMKKGNGFSDSLKAIHQGKVFFEQLYLALIEAAEATGSIEKVLERIVIDLQRKEHAKENAINLLIYPLMIVFIAIAGTIIIIAKGMPFFVSEGMLSENIIQDAKMGIATAGMVLLLGGGGLFITYFKIFNNDSPESRIFYLLDFLLQSNISLIDALSQCIVSLGHTKYGNALVTIKNDIASGKSFSGAFARAKYFSGYILGWLSIADRQGNLNEICANIKDYYAVKDKKLRDAASKLIEPIVIVFVGLYVLIIMLTVVLPMLSFAGGIL